MTHDLSAISRIELTIFLCGRVPVVKVFVNVLFWGSNLKRKKRKKMKRQSRRKKTRRWR
jgi:hypothetical protein